MCVTCYACYAGPLPVPERWNEESGKAAFDLEETDPSDQVCVMII